VDKKFYSVRELAEASGYSVGTIQNRIAGGDIFAVQGARRGAFRIPAASYQAYLASLGVSPKPSTSFLPPTQFVETSASELFRREIEPVLERAGYPDMPTLLRAVEVDPSLYERYRDAIHAYATYLAQAAQARELVPA
jgi:hypothetical protein